MGRRTTVTSISKKMSLDPTYPVWWMMRHPISVARTAPRDRYTYVSRKGEWSNWNRVDSIQ